MSFRPQSGRRDARVYVLALLFCYASISSAASGNRRRFTLDGGVWGSNLKQRQSAETGYADELSRVAAAFRIRAHLPLGKKLAFEPSFLTVLPWRSSVDGSSQVFTSDLGLHLLLPIFSFLDFRVGPGIYWEFHRSSQGPVTLNNGTSSSVFYLPGRASNVFLFTAEAGITLWISRRVSLSVDALATRLASESKRRYHGFISLGWNL